MEKIAEIIYKAYLQSENKKQEKPPVGIDEASRKFLSGLSERQHKEFLDLESLYLDLVDIRAVAVIEYILNLINEDEC